MKIAFVKKAISLTLFYSLIFTQVACSTDDAAKQYGEIADVEIETSESETDKQNVFTEVDSPFDYQYQVITAERAYMKFKIPAKWTVTVDNGRHFEINAPKDDPYLPGQTIHVLYNYNLMNVYRETVGQYDEIFSSDRSRLFYNIDGTRYRQTDYVVPTSQDTDTSFSNRGDMLSISTYKNFQVVDAVMGRFPETTCTGLYYNVKWAGTPCSFSAVCKEELEEDVLSLLRYMVSSITYVPQNINTTHEVTVDNITLTLPVELTKNSHMDNVFLASPYENNAFTGIGVGVFQIPDGEIDTYEFCQTEADKIALSFLPNVCDNMYAPYPDIYEISIDGKPAEVFYVSASIHLTETDATKYYPTGSTCMMYLYALQGDGTTRDVICLWFQDDQTEQAESMMSLIQERAIVK